MTLSKTQKIVLGIFTFSPFLFFPVIFWQVFQVVIDIVRESEHGGEPDPSHILMAVFSFIIPIIFLGLGCIALFIFYMIHAIGNKNLQPAEQVLWILLFFFFGIIAFPVYWLIRIWNT